MRKGFTLAEILIVLIVIGFVSLLTVPSLVEMYKFRVLSAQFNRVYSDLTTAVTQAIQDENANNKTDTGFYVTKYYTDNFQTIAKFFDDYVVAMPKDGNMYITDKALTNSDNIFGSGSSTVNYLNINGNSSDSWAKYTLSTTLTDYEKYPCAKNKYGAIICFYRANDVVRPVIKEQKMLNSGAYEVSNIIASAENPTIFLVDTNGQKAPNVSGYDFFVFMINDDGTLSDVYVNDDNGIHTVPSSECSKVGDSDPGENNRWKGTFGCVNRVIENGMKVEPFKN